jgi:hypothetical protein
MKAQDVVAMARETLGTPYRPHGRVNGLELDCAGVVIHTCRRLGLSEEILAGYTAAPEPLEVLGLLKTHFDRVAQVRFLRPGDIAWIRAGKVEPTHLAVVGDYLGEGLSLIHAADIPGFDRVVEHRMDAVWQGRIVSGWRFKGLDGGLEP